MDFRGIYGMDPPEGDLRGLKDADYGAVFGGGIDVALDPGKLVFDARYTIGLARIYDVGTDVKNRVISLMLGYSF